MRSRFWLAQRGGMTKRAFDKIAEGLTEALAVARGEAEPYRVWEQIGRDIVARYPNTLDALATASSDQISDQC